MHRNVRAKSDLQSILTRPLTEGKAKAQREVPHSGRTAVGVIDMRGPCLPRLGPFLLTACPFNLFLFLNLFPFLF